jgi:hypothetical protein
VNRYLIAAALIAAGVYAAMWYNAKPDMPPGIHLPAAPAKELRGIETESVIIDFVKVYKPAAKKKLDLPADIQANEDLHVVSSVKTANDERQHTITTLLNKSTNEFTTLDRVDPHPWLAVNTKTEIGLMYGLKGGDQIIRLQGQQTLLQIKAVRVGATATLDSDGESFIGIGAWARW